MEYQAGAQVVSADGETVGKLDRVVIDPRDRKVTHLVVAKGTLFKTDRVVPIEMVAQADRERIDLRQPASELELLPEYEELHYVLADEGDWVRRPGAAGTTAPGSVAPGQPPVAANPIPNLYWYPPTAMGYPGFTAAGVIPFRGSSGAGQTTEVVRNIPDETVPLKEGAKVIAADGQNVGSLERVITDSQSEQVTHLLISKGLFLKSRKVVPVNWVLDVADDEVRLAVGSELLQGLRDYEDDREARDRD